MKLLEMVKKKTKEKNILLFIGKMAMEFFQ